MISRSGLAPIDLQAALQPLHFAAHVGDGAVLFVGGGGGKDHVGALRGLGEEHVLHHHESAAGCELSVLQRIRAHHPEHVQSAPPAFRRRPGPARAAG